MVPETIKWHETTLSILDQRKIPLETCYMECTRYEQVALAIESMAIRGAPAIGIAASYGVVLASLEGRETAE
nr:S-methyl-5-thioribose-1-phosphate isomerase [Synergistales bacterium]